MHALLSRGRASATADAIGGSVELAAAIGIPLAIVFFIAVILAIYSSKPSNKEKEPEVREVSGESLYDRLARERTWQTSGRDDSSYDGYRQVQMGGGRNMEAESEVLLTAPQPSRPRSSDRGGGDDYRV